MGLLQEQDSCRSCPAARACSGHGPAGSCLEPARGSQTLADSSRNLRLCASDCRNNPSGAPGKQQSVGDIAARGWAGSVLQLASATGFTPPCQELPQANSVGVGREEPFSSGRGDLKIKTTAMPWPDASDARLAGRAFLSCTQTSPPCVLLGLLLCSAEAGEEDLSTLTGRTWRVWGG